MIKIRVSANADRGVYWKPDITDTRLMAVGDKNHFSQVKRTRTMRSTKGQRVGYIEAIMTSGEKAISTELYPIVEMEDK